MKTRLAWARAPFRRFTFALARDSLELGRLESEDLICSALTFRCSPSCSDWT